MTTVDQLLATENKRVLANYMVWRIVLQSISSLNKNYREIYFNYNRVLNGLNQEAPRFDTCVSRVQEWMGLSMSSLYVKNHFDKESKKQANILVEYLMKEFKHILKNTDWMDADTKAKALEKADAFKTWIGYPDHLLNDTLVNEYYEKLNITPDEYYKNVFTYNRFITDKSYFKLRQPNDKNDWKKHALAATVNNNNNSIEVNAFNLDDNFFSQVNAFNYLDDNSIEFPAAILQKQFYNSKRPNYLNFGAIGMVGIGGLLILARYNSIATYFASFTGDRPRDYAWLR